MSDPPYDPYAPPREDVLPPTFPKASLPEGIRRHGLDVTLYRDQIARGLRARVVRGVVLGIGYFIFLVRIASFPLDSLFVAVPVWAVVIGGSFLFARARMRRLEPRVVQGYELLVSPRVLRRTAHGFAPAEILAPEVSSIVEVPEGLSLVSRNPTRRLFVARSVDRFAEVRDHLRAWSPIEPRAGIRAFFRRRSHASGEKTRDVLDGALANDPSLRGELEAVRVLAMPFDPRSVRARRSLRVVLVLWLLLIALFLAIWQVLSPARPAPARRRQAEAGETREMPYGALASARFCGSSSTIGYLSSRGAPSRS